MSLSLRLNPSWKFGLVVVGEQPYGGALAGVLLGLQMIGDAYKIANAEIFGA
jgi:hypothetical protein